MSRGFGCGFGLWSLRCREIDFLTHNALRFHTMATAWSDKIYLDTYNIRKRLLRSANVYYDDNIIVLKPDKGNGVVILGR